MTQNSHLSIIRVEGVLVATVPAHPTDATIADLQENLLATIYDHNPDEITGVILDIALVNVVDSFFARTVAETVQMIELMGAHPVVVGMRPSVAITATELGYSLGGVDTALNTDAALQILGGTGAIHE